MSDLVEVKIPDIGDLAEVEIIEILVREGDIVSAEDPLLTLESDKATMEIPAPANGKISEVIIKVGQAVSEGALVMRIDNAVDGVNHGTEQASKTASAEAKNQQLDNVPGEKTKNQDSVELHIPPKNLLPPEDKLSISLPHASPSVRRFARELGADLSQIRGSGAKGRILREDVKNCFKQLLNSQSMDMGFISMPEVDFSQFGETKTISLSRIKKLSGPHLQAAWLNIPHVTHHDEADITELEEFRQSLNKEAEIDGIHITMLTFVTKILASALKKFPNFNASLHPNGDSLILKKYFHIGIAVDTTQGLVVPIIRDVDRKSIFELAREMRKITVRARDQKLNPKDFNGGSMSISSLGGIGGGTAFTPIVNAPEVAILGISRAKMSPIWNGTGFDPRLILPLDLSYDHRVIDGAEAARFTIYLTKYLGDIRRLSL